MQADVDLDRINRDAANYGSVRHLASLPFGARLEIELFELGNGLRIVCLVDSTAPIVAYHTWFRVGSRHERLGKTGLAHLFEHLMFGETRNHPKGEFDSLLEEAGAEVNASTWLDFTHYHIAAPSQRLDLLVELESERMQNLVLQPPQVSSEKEVVANERRYRVEDDVDGAVNELLWATAFKEHAYRWPTIGWMQDIQGFTPADCEEFYRTYYAPNNATLVLAGDFSLTGALTLISRAYGTIAPADLPVENVYPEPPQVEERRVEVTKPTLTEKVALGYHAPALGDFDHPAVSLLCEVLFGGRASRVVRRLVRELELASDVRAFVGPFRDPGLIEMHAAARSGHTADELLAVMDTEIQRIQSEPLAKAELDRVRARFELGLLHGMESCDGKANMIGFYECLLRRPTAAREQFDELARVTPSDILRVARRYLRVASRSVVLVRGSAVAPSVQGELVGGEDSGDET